MRKSGFAAMLAAVSAFALLAAPGHAQAPAAAPTPAMPIYSSALAPGWSNWSWAHVVLGVTIADPDEHPISVEAQGWQALYLQHAPFSTTGYTTLTFFVHGGVHGGQVIHVQAVDAQGHALPNHYVAVTAPANDWLQVDMPLSDIGAVNQTIGGFWIQNGTPNPEEKFLVNEISLH